MSGKAFVTIVNGGNLEIQGLAFNGEGEAGKALSEGGITVKSGTITPYLLTVDNCEFYNFNESGLAAIRGEKSTFLTNGDYPEFFFFMTCQGKQLILLERKMIKVNTM